MTEYKYAIANIQIPLKLFPNGEYETMMENLHITFTETDTLPESNETEISGEFQTIVQNMFAPTTTTTTNALDSTALNSTALDRDKLTVLVTEIAPKYSRAKLNVSFKQRYGN